jgi:hypothetical protein
MRVVLLSSFFLAVSVSFAQVRQGMQMPITPRQIAADLSKVFQPEEQKTLHDKVVRLFGLQNLTQGRAGAKIEATTVAWATIDPHPARVVQQDGSLIGEMTALGDDGLQVLVAQMPNFSEIGYRIESEGMPRLAGTVHIEHFDYTADSLPHKDVPQGKLERFEWKNSQIFPDTLRDVTVYLPAAGFHARRGNLPHGLAGRHPPCRSQRPHARDRRFRQSHSPEADAADRGHLHRPRPGSETEAR